MEFPVPFFVTLTIPTNAGVGAARIVLDGIHGAILVYSNSPQGKGSLVYSLSFTNFTDPYGNQVKRLMNLGVWDPTTGLMDAHLGVDGTGNMYLVDTNGATRMLMANGSLPTGPSSNTDPAIWFFNAFGAIVLVVDPNAGGTFQYQDLGSATQGGLIGAQMAKTGPDPVQNRTINPGITIINPVFGDQTTVLGSIITQVNLNFNQSFTSTPAGGTPSGAIGPAQNFFGPWMTGLNNVILALFGESPDTTVDAGLLITKATAAQTQGVKKTNALLEVQGFIGALLGASAANAYFASVTGDTFTRWLVDSNGKQQWGTGAAAPDVSIARSAVGVLDLVGSLIVSAVLTATGGTISTPTLITTDSWHAIPGIGTNGWSIVTGQPVPSYRMQADGMVHICGAATHAAFTANTQLSTALPTAYRPTTEITQAANNGTEVEITTAGIINVIPSGSQTAVQFSIRYPVDL